MLSRAELELALTSLQPIDLRALGIPRPHFLRAATMLDGGRTLVGEVWFPKTYEALRDRGARVNAAECMHAAWNAAHVISTALGGGELRARRVTITPGRRPVLAETPLVLVAQIKNVVDRERDYSGEYTAELCDRTGRVLLTANVDFWAGRLQKTRHSPAGAAF